MRNLIRRWINADRNEKTLFAIELAISNIETNIRRLNTNLAVTNSAIGQVVAKLNPILAVPEDDLARVAASKEMGDKIIKRLKDEQNVLEHYNLTPKADQ